jgi:hypothetical protein
MAFFDSTQLALANGLSVIFGELYEVHFTSGTRFYWDGFGPLVAYSHTWLGSGQLVQRSEIQFGVNDDAGSLTLTLSGVDDETEPRAKQRDGILTAADRIGDSFSTRRRKFRVIDSAIQRDDGRSDTRHRRASDRDDLL